jgi:hypothetical protein
MPHLCPVIFFPVKAIHPLPPFSLQKNLKKDELLASGLSERGVDLAIMIPEYAGVVPRWVMLDLLSRIGSSLGQINYHLIPEHKTSF